MYTEIRLPYGDSSLSVRLPTRNVVKILTARYVSGIVNEQAAIIDALRNPVQSPPLKERLNQHSKVVIITTDNTRACPDDKIVPAILQELAEVIPKRNITIMVALGLHSPLTRHELNKKLGSEIVEKYRVVNHDIHQTVFLGSTSFGTPVEVNSTVVEADFRISTGFVEPHFFAGFSGGRKSIAPGVSSARAIRHNHSYALIEHPRARAGILDGNPIHEDMLEQAKMAGLDFIVNVLLNKDKQITHVLAGNPWTAHRTACDIERDIVRAEIDHKVDITLVTNGGAPLDLDFYQTVKGIDTACKITRPGGVIIAAAACNCGLGAEAFSSLHAACNCPDEVLERIKAGNKTGVSWQNQILAKAQMGHTIYLCSGIADSQVKSMLVNPVQTVKDGLDRAFGLLGDQAEIAVIPEGPLILPAIAGNLE